MTGAGEFVLWAAVTAGILPALWTALQIFCGLGADCRRTAPSGAGFRLVILVPAHDEEARIPATLAALTPLCGPGDRILVIADNCRDGTAAVAARAGAEVVVRCDPDSLGKGQALAFGMGTLARDAGDVLGVIDADTIPGPHALDLLARRAFRDQVPVQGCFLHSPPPAADAWAAFNCFAILVNNLVRQRGRSRLGLPAQVSGSGLFLPLDIARGIDWSSTYLAEDAELGLDLALQGHPAVFESGAFLTSPAPVGDAATLAQRSSWMAGRTCLAGRRTIGSVVEGCRCGRPRAIVAAIDLATPPTSITAGLLGAALLPLGLAHLVSMPLRLPLLAWSIAAGFFVTAVCLVWLIHGRKLLAAAELVHVPGILARQARSVISRTIRRQVHWRHYREPGRGGG